MEVTHFGCVTVPLHFLIDFPADYPQSAPNIGFSFEFEYRGGAQYIMPNGRLKGKKVICLDVLGNFGDYHREWKNSVGSGWSPAYTVTTLLVQLRRLPQGMEELGGEWVESGLYSDHTTRATSATTTGNGRTRWGVGGVRLIQ